MPNVGYNSAIVASSEASTLPSSTNRPQAGPRLHTLGYWSLLLLAVMLPFELTQRPFFSSSLVVINNLNICLYLVAGLAALSLIEPVLSLAGSLRSGQIDQNNVLYRQRWLLLLLGGLTLAALLSSWQASAKTEGFKWTAQLLIGGLVWLGVIIWLDKADEGRINRLISVLIVGATVAATVGLGEFVLGRGFANSLGWFKQQPTEAGPYLRLSGTFEYANVAAAYFELTLPLAIAGLVRQLGRDRRYWQMAAWGGAVVILLAALLLTVSRGAVFGLAVGLVAMLIVARRFKIEWRRWRIGLGLVVAVVAVVGVIAAIQLPQIALRFNSQSDQDWFQASYNSTPPATLAGCQRLFTSVTVTNRGPQTWSIESRKPYNLSYHWLYPSGQIARFEGVRSGLTADLPPGGSQRVEAQLVAPDTPGSYLLVWDMVQEDTSWFGLKTGQYQTIPITVKRVAPNEEAQACDESNTVVAESQNGARLPAVKTQPDRLALWQAAVNMLAARPLLGVGPHGFRLNYGSFAVPVQTNWNTSIFANNLYLELLADLGLIGATLWLAFFVALNWRFVAGLWGSNRVAPWTIAVVGAVAAFWGHGLLDYFLGSHALNTLSWLLFGLAALRTRNKSEVQ